MSEQPSPAMDLANMRKNGVRHVVAYCLVCNHSADVLVDHLPEDTPVPSLKRRMRCSACGSRDIDVRPAWHRKDGRRG